MNAINHIAKEPGLYDLAAEVLTLAGGDTHAAAAQLSNRILEDRKLRLTIAEEAIEIASRIAVQSTMRHRRATIWAGATAPKTNIVALANGIANSILDFPLAGGKALRDATRDEVLAQAQLYAKASKDMGAKSRWLTAVARLLPEGKTVGDALSESKVLELHQKEISK